MRHDRVVEVEFRGAARDLMSARESEVLCSGAAGTGKTVAALYKVHLTCMAKAGVRALVLRKTHASLTSSTLVTFRRKVAHDAIALGYLKFFGGSASEPAAFRYANGSTIVLGGLDKPTKLLSTDYDLILVDEAIETSPDDLDILVTRLRNGVLPYQQLIMLTNPGAPTHHLKVRADSGRCRHLYSRHEDNPAYYQDGEWTEAGRKYRDILQTLPTVRRQRFFLGMWVAAEGLIYDEYDPAVHLLDPFTPPADWDRIITVDFGYNNPFVAMWTAVSPDGRLHVYRELYKTGMLVEDAAREMLKMISIDKGKPSRIICDHDAEDRATLEKHLGYSTIAAKKDVKQGIDAVSERLRKDGTGKPLLYIHRNSVKRKDPVLVESRRPTCLEEEITAYVWDTRSQPGSGTLREAPVKQDDHSCDALRYAVCYVDLQERPRYRYFVP